MHLSTTNIATVPKQDDRRTILAFVHSQQSFAKAHAKEGKTYMASWKDESETIGPTSEKEHPVLSCGFATPVLKPRKPPLAGSSSHNGRHARKGKEFDSKPECSTDVRKANQVKSRDKTTQCEERRRNRPKRGPDLQTDEEQRLQERREKKKARRDIMRPESSKKKQADVDLQSKTKKKKQNLPSGLALMYGFTASNVGQKRLTVGSLARPGVFGKGKASVQATVRKSKQKSTRNNAIFSESDFLKSAGKDLGDKGATHCSSTSDTTSSGGSDGLEQIEPETRVRRVAHDKHKLKAVAQSRPVTLHKTGTVVTNASKESAEQSPSTKSPSPKPSSVIWDIEKVDAVLPAESSSLVSLDPKPSTLLLDVAQKRWPLENSHTDGVQEAGLSIEQADSAAKAPSISSIRPSESPSQVNHPAVETGQNLLEGVSRYFASGALPQVERNMDSPKDTGCVIQIAEETDCAIQIPEETAPAQAVSQVVGPLGFLDHCAEQFTAPDSFKLGFDPELLIFGDEIAHYPRRNLDDSDWLLSDPFMGEYSTPPSVKDDWAALEDISMTGLEDDYEHGPTAFELVGYPYEESRRDSALSLWLGEGPQGDRYSEELIGFNECVDIPNLEQTSDEDTELDWNDLIYLESDGSESDSDLRETIKSSQEDIRDTERDHLICFDEGRYLLHGYRISEAVNNLELVEADVAQSLVGHWKPQRY